jgi:hypothetical protein
MLHGICLSKVRGWLAGSQMEIREQNEFYGIAESRIAPASPTEVASKAGKA